LAALLIPVVVGVLELAGQVLVRLGFAALGVGGGGEQGREQQGAAEGGSGWQG